MTISKSVKNAWIALVGFVLLNQNICFASGVNDFNQNIHNSIPPELIAGNRAKVWSSITHNKVPDECFILPMDSKHCPLVMGLIKKDQPIDWRPLDYEMNRDYTELYLRGQLVRKGFLLSGYTREAGDMQVYHLASEFWLFNRQESPEQESTPQSIKSFIDLNKEQITEALCKKNDAYCYFALEDLNDPQEFTKAFEEFDTRFENSTFKQDLTFILLPDGIFKKGKGLVFGSKFKHIKAVNKVIHEWLEKTFKKYPKMTLIVDSGEFHSSIDDNDLSCTSASFSLKQEQSSVLPNHRLILDKDFLPSCINNLIIMDVNKKLYEIGSYQLSGFGLSKLRLVHMPLIKKVSSSFARGAKIDVLDLSGVMNVEEYMTRDFQEAHFKECNLGVQKNLKSVGDKFCYEAEGIKAEDYYFTLKYAGSNVHANLPMIENPTVVNKAEDFYKKHKEKFVGAMMGAGFIAFLTCEQFYKYYYN